MSLISPVVGDGHRTNNMSLNHLRDLIDKSTFESVGLHKDIGHIAGKLGLKKPAAIQVMAIPHILEGHDVLCAAETGGGKTFAYLLPIIQKLKEDEVSKGFIRMARRPRSIVLVPSKELVHQVVSVAKSLAHHAKFRVEGIFDRIPKHKETTEGQIDLIVGTPQKLLYQFTDQRLQADDIQSIIIDEADTLFIKDFGEKVREILGYLKNNSSQEKIQKIFITATVPKTLDITLEKEFGNKIVRISTPRLHRAVPSLRQRFIKLSGYGDNKQKALSKVLLELPPKDQKTIIFCNRLGSCLSLEGWLTSLPDVMEMVGGVDAFAVLHNRIKKEDRFKIIEQFNEGKITTLLCTDLVSRGMDLVKVDHVILYDFPKSAVDYLHRVGRTARCGAPGRATSLVGKYDEKLAKEIQIALKK